MIFYLIYLSAAKQLYTENDLSQILLSSRLNNKALDVTGILLYHEGSILQVLEGSEENVMKLYFKIAQDDRHHNVIKMVSGTTEERNFPEWSMGFKSVKDIEWNEFAGYLSLDNLNILPKLKKVSLRIDTVVKSFMAVNVRE